MESLRQRLGGRADVRRADSSGLPFPGESFDAVVSLPMLHHVGAWERALGECVRVLRPGGLLVGYDLVGRDRMERLQRRAGEGSERLMRWREVSAVFRDLPLEQYELHGGLGVFIRFSAVR